MKLSSHHIEVLICKEQIWSDYSNNKGLIPRAPPLLQEETNFITHNEEENHDKHMLNSLAVIFSFICGSSLFSCIEICLLSAAFTVTCMLVLFDFETGLSCVTLSEVYLIYFHINVYLVLHWLLNPL